MKRIFTLLIVSSLLFPTVVFGQLNAYCLPGLGSDYRIFNDFESDSNITISHIQYPVPVEGETMQSYALKLSKQIDTTKPFILIGTSIGGMLSVELSEILSPQKTFIIASAKCRQELPLQYRFQRVVPVHKLIPDQMIRNATRLLQPIFETDSKSNLDLYRDMLDQKDSNFMKRAVEMILLWDRSDFDDSIIHIHGTKDHTLPFRYVNPTHVINEGSHMMTLTRSADIRKIIINELSRFN